MFISSIIYTEVFLLLFFITDDYKVLFLYILNLQKFIRNLATRTKSANEVKSAHLLGRVRCGQASVLPPQLYQQHRRMGSSGVSARSPTRSRPPQVLRSGSTGFNVDKNFKACMMPSCHCKL